LITIGVISFLPFTRKFLILNILAIYGPYLASIGYYFPELETLRILIVHLFFILGTLIIALTNRTFTEKLKKEEVINRFLLETELTQRERIIEEKTREGLKLQTLTKQFSPQVVHAIVSGKLNVIETVHRSNICAIFIDIVNSTERILRIDKDDVNKVISLFMEDNMRVLLKYDITIDKFLGDGVLAFSNDPIKHHDYVERVVHAALEIRERIKKNEEHYVEHWLNELQITVGIASGYADVGFYGSDSSFKAYTAIGRVINLASRLCSIAEPSQILVSQDVAKQISTSRFSVTRLGPKKLKGFEADIINVFEVQNYSEELPIDTNIRECPNGHGVLHLDVNMDGIYVFKCRICGFEMSSAA
jgi:class 3 adenylate cyclase